MKMPKKKGYVEQRSGKIRVNSSLEPSIYDKLDTLAAACGVSPTTLVNYFTELCLTNENIVNFTQDKYKAWSRFRIIPTKDDGEVKYIITEKKRA